MNYTVGYSNNALLTSTDALLTNQAFNSGANFLTPTAGLELSTAIAQRTNPATSLVFIEPDIADSASLVAGLESNADVYVLNPAQDAVQQITQVLLQYSGISSLHIVSHGAAAGIELGQTWLTQYNLNTYSSQLQSWSTALTADADILLYGCNVAQGESGLAFVQQLAQLTGADIAASNDLTGSSQLGGNWNLEVNTGDIAASLAFSAAAQVEYGFVLANPVVTLPQGAIAYTENATPSVIDSTATVTDADLPANFNNGTLTVSLTAGSSVGDRLAIRNQGNSAGQIGLDGRIVKFSGTQIGTYAGGIGTENLVISLNSAATPVAVEALLRNLTYASVEEDLPASGDRTLSIVLNDGTGGISAPATKTISVSGINDAPSLGSNLTLYDGTTNLLPIAAGSAPGGPWLAYRDSAALGGSATQTAGAGGTTLDSDQPIYAGYSNYRFTQNTSLTSITFTPSPVNTAFPTLDRNAGYVVSFTSQVIDETRAASANKNNDGKDDRAGFSVIVLGNDLKGIELGFWEDRIWAQEDGTTQANPSLEPDTAPASNFRTLFTQAELVNFNTTALTSYDLAILGNTYTLFSNGTPLLSGKLRDYTAFVPPSLTIGFTQITLPDPYALSNFVFLGDNTPSAEATVKINAVSVATNAPLAAKTVNQNTPLVLSGGYISDIDANTSNVSVTLAAAHGTITVNTAIPNGLTASNITNNGSALVTLTGSLTQINNTLINTSALTYQGFLNFFGTDTLTITANDGGATGGNAQTATRNVSITVNQTAPLNSAPILSTTANPTLNNVPYNSTNPTGTSVSTLISRLAGISDADAGALKGIAVTAIDNTHGQWQFSTNGGTTWTNFGSSVSDSNARLLSNVAGTRVRFVPGLNYLGSASIAFRAWDQTTGSNGGNASSILNGGTTAFSAAVETAVVTVTTPSAVKSDFNGDGVSDLFWRNQATGENILWLLDENGLDVFVPVLSVDLQYSVAATKDFNRDGYLDIFWRNAVTGDNVIWLMNGTTLSSFANLFSVAPSWNVAAAEDFNNDGSTDLLWRNQVTGENVIWKMNGTTLASFTNLLPVAPGWSIAAAKDLDNNGTIDLFWRNAGTGENVIWKMNGFAFSSFVNLFPVAPGWTIAAAEDFDKDGSTDFFWRNEVTGENVVWKMNGTSLVSFTNLFPVAPGLQIAATQDFNNDGYIDFLWRNQATGDNIVWLMNGITVNRFYNLLPVASVWKPVRGG